MGVSGAIWLATTLHYWSPLAEAAAINGPHAVRCVWDEGECSVMMNLSEPATLRKLRANVQPPPPAELEAFGECERGALLRRLAEVSECVIHPAFQAPDAETRLLGDMPPGPVLPPPPPRRRKPRNDDSGVDLLASAALPRALTPEQEQHQFLKFNYARYRVLKLLKQHTGRALTAATARELIRWDRLVRETRDSLVRANVALVLAMAKRTRISAVDHADLISEGNLALLRSVDKFDCARGFKFSTYACRAILKSFSRVATRTARHRGHFPTEFDPTLEKSDHLDEKRKSIEDNCVIELRAILGRNLAELSEIERQVIRARFAIDEPGSEAPAAPAEGEQNPRIKTLEQVGELIGVTKERVRQIQNKALVKLRSLLEDGVLTS